MGGEEVCDGGRAGGGGVRQYHSSNIFHPLRPSSEPLLVGDRSDLISHMTFAGRRSGGATRGGLSATPAPDPPTPDAGRAALISPFYLPHHSLRRRMDH